MACGMHLQFILVIKDVQDNKSIRMMVVVLVVVMMTVSVAITITLTQKRIFGWKYVSIMLFGFKFKTLRKTS